MEDGNITIHLVIPASMHNRIMREISNGWALTPSEFARGAIGEKLRLLEGGMK